MANKLRRFIALTAALVATTALAGCNDIEATLNKSDGDSKILEIDGLTNNYLSRIYDALVTSGDTNSEKVLNNVLGLISESQFGTFYGEGGLLEAVNGGDSKIDAYVSAHSAFANADGDSDVAHSRARVKTFYKLILQAIQENFFSAVKNSSYQERSIFIEKKFYMAEKGNYYSLLDVNEADFKEVQVDGSDTYEDVDKYFSPNYLLTYQDYIEKSILKSYMRSSLVEQYLYGKNYGALGRSYARKVQYVKIADNSKKEYAYASQRLVKAFGKDVLEDASVTDVDLNFLSELDKGYFDWATISAEKKTLIEKIYGDASDGTKIFVKVTAPAGADYQDYYTGTTYGNYIEDYVKITDNRFDETSDFSSILSSFTGSGAYRPEVGLAIKTQSLITEDKTTEGWYTSSGLSDLPSAIKTRLFKISVANEVDTDAVAADAASYAHKELDYGWYLNGHYYVTPATYESSNTQPYVIQDSDNACWYIVRVDEAVKTAKLSSGDGALADVTYREEIARIVASLLSDNSTYTSTANQYYVDQAAIAFNDDYVYDYFEKTFPDLYDD